MKVINWDSNTVVRIQLWDIAGEFQVYQFIICKLDFQCLITGRFCILLRFIYVDATCHYPLSPSQHKKLQHYSSILTNTVFFFVIL